MNKNIITLTILGVIIFGCDKNNCNPETIIATWSEGKEINIMYDSLYQRLDYNVDNGENLLFVYNHTGQQCDYIMDDEWGESLIFEINYLNAKFEFVDSNIILTKCFYQEYGAWVRHNRYQVKDGIIKGKKISEDKWEITVSVITTPIFPDEKAKIIEFKKSFSKLTTTI